jgi:hypothetical protein
MQANVMGDAPGSEMEWNEPFFGDCFDKVAKMITFVSRKQNPFDRFQILDQDLIKEKKIIFYLHIFVYILSAEPVNTNSTRSSLKPPKKTCFFVRHVNPHRTFTARAPHARLCGEFTSQPHVRCGILAAKSVHQAPSR